MYNLLSFNFRVIEGDFEMKYLAIGLVFGLVLLSGCLDGGTGLVSLDTSISSNVGPTQIQTFSETNNEICKEDGKPIIRLFSTTWCPHCKWVSNAFESTVQEYVNEGKIVAYHWEVDIGDNTLTTGRELSVPASETAIFKQFNSRESIPTFVFGCKYYRIGNGFESQNNLDAEIGEFKAVIEALLDK